MSQWSMTEPEDMIDTHMSDSDMEDIQVNTATNNTDDPVDTQATTLVQDQQGAAESDDIERDQQDATVNVGELNPDDALETTEQEMDVEQGQNAIDVILGSCPHEDNTTAMDSVQEDSTVALDSSHGDDDSLINDAQQDDTTTIDGVQEEATVALDSAHGNNESIMNDAQQDDVAAMNHSRGDYQDPSDPSPHEETDPVTRLETHHDSPGQEHHAEPQNTEHTNAYQQQDSSDLFVSESGTPPPDITAAPVQMPPPLRSLPQAEVKSLSTFSKIRNIQKKLQEKKNSAEKRPAPVQNHYAPNNEAFFEAVQERATRSSLPREVDEVDKEHQSALAVFNKNKALYDGFRDKVTGKLHFKHDIEWMKIQTAEAARLRKRKRDSAVLHKIDEENLFPNFTLESHDSPEPKPSSAFGGFEPGPSRRAQHWGSLSGPASMLDLEHQAMEKQAMEVALDAESDLPRKRQKGDQSTEGDSASTSSPGKKGTPTTKSKPKASKSKGSNQGSTRKTRSAAKATENAFKQTSSLLISNVFAQQARDGDADQPVFQGRNKQAALKELIASVPLEDQKQKRSDMNTLLSATKDFNGHGAAKLANGGNWLVRGMKTSLKNYQLLGSAFMRRRENGIEEPRGGLMADQMGLGKTLMMLANIVNGRPPPEKKPRPKTTLLVASPALLTQWQSEIEKHTDCGLSVVRYASGTRLHTNNNEGVLPQFDIVLTTYGEIMRSYPKNEPPIWCQTTEQKNMWWQETYNKHRGILHRLVFLRVVLDEAQAIKNHKSRTSLACRALMATHKWALSGTPILNGLTELYPYFKFLNVPHTGSFKIFKHNYCDPNSGETTERLSLRLSSFMIRRTHDDRLFNAPILKLPQAAQTLYWCNFNSVERCVYNVVHKRFTERINTWARQGELNKSYSNAMVMLLRLRQLTAHILMLQFVMKDLLEREDIEQIKDIVNEQAAASTSEASKTILAIRKQLDKHAIDEKNKAVMDAKVRAAAKAANVTVEEYKRTHPQMNSQPEQEPGVEEPEDTILRTSSSEGSGAGNSGEKFGKDYNFIPYLKSLRAGQSWEDAKERAECSWCSKQPKGPWITSCGHLICGVPCLEESNLIAAEKGEARSSCRACGSIPHNVQPCEVEEDEYSDPVSQGTRSKAQRNKSKARRGRDMIPEDWIASISGDVLPSAKTIALKAQILNWITENPNVKIIVYTQFLAMVKIIARVCQMEDWGTEEYIGTMSFKARDKAINTFANNSKCNILVASLHCGGLGLNLTMASRVIMVDPWWNSAAEQQAFCRVFRIGQKDETFMSRLVVRNTVDERLMNMQQRKEEEINDVMENTEGAKNLSIRDLMRLFGNLDMDEEGKPFIMVDNPAPYGGFRADEDHEGYADED